MNFLHLHDLFSAVLWFGTVGSCLVLLLYACKLQGRIPLPFGPSERLGQECLPGVFVSQSISQPSGNEVDERRELRRVLLVQLIFFLLSLGFATFSYMSFWSHFHWIVPPTLELFDFYPEFPAKLLNMVLGCATGQCLSQLLLSAQYKFVTGRKTIQIWLSSAFRANCSIFLFLNILVLPLLMHILTISGLYAESAQISKLILFVLVSLLPIPLCLTGMNLALRFGVPRIYESDPKVELLSNPNCKLEDLLAKSDEELHYLSRLAYGLGKFQLADRICAAIVERSAAS